MAGHKGIFLRISSKALVGLLVIGMLFAPIAPAFAQEVSVDSGASSTPTTTPDTPSDSPVPDSSSPSDTPPPDISLTASDSSDSTSDSSLTSDVTTPSVLDSSSDPGPLPEPPSLFTYNSVNPKVDNSTGALTYRIPLDIPPGRNKVQPDLALEYNSQNTEDGIVGYGWSVSIPYIERLNKRGSENLYTDNYFTSSLGGELATTSDPTQYRHKVEDGQFIKYTFTNNTWVAYDKNGTRYEFGSTTQAQQSDPSDSSRIYRWMLEEVRDTNGNYIRYEYSKDTGQIYPTHIYYTGSGSTDGLFQIDFATSTRPDPIISYKEGFEATTSARISEIKALSNGQWVRKYSLSYTAGSNGVRSLLASVQETGRDGQGTELALPAITFGYASSTNAFAAQNNVQTVRNSAYVVADRNGDGLNDVTTSFYNNAGSNKGYHFWTGVLGNESSFT